MKNLKVFFYIDALDSSILTSTHMPFLYNIAAKHSRWDLHNVLGYSFAIQACMLSGKYPEENNHWMPYFYSPESSPTLFKLLNKIGILFPIDKQPSLRFIIEGQCRKLLLNKGVHINNVPLGIVNKISLYPYYYMCELPFFDELSITFDRNDSKLTYIGPPFIRKHFYSILLEHVKASQRDNETVFVYDDALDGLGHKFGPTSQEYLLYARSLDRVLNSVYRQLRATYGDRLTFLVFSDHGQSQLKGSFDIISQIEAYDLHFAKDYICFVDATMAMFWVTDKAVREKITSALSSLKFGTLLSNSQRKKYNLQFRNEKMYGDLIYVMNPGWSLFPNFFSPFHPMKGLHGYLPEEPVQNAFLISDTAIDHDIFHIKDIKDVLIGLSRDFH
ncbi:MAG: alkaline phosphatase family protein [Candidatus Bathyarchaeia archaeon]